MKMYEYFLSGGSIMWILLGMSVFGVAIIGWKILNFKQEKKNIQQTASDILKKVAEARGNVTDDMEVLDLAKDQIFTFSHDLEKGINTIKIIATIAPLLGLFGTVVGIFMAFQSIAVNGMSDPSVFAEGISLALITTIGGLIVAIPHYISYNYLVGWINSYEVRLEKSIITNYFKKANTK